MALAAQGFAGSRPMEPASRASLLRQIERLGLLQIDSVSAVVRSHYLPLFSRLGPYPRELLDGLAYAGRRRRLFEYWGHEASLMPVRAAAAVPLANGARPRRPGHLWPASPRSRRERAGYVDAVLAEVRARGPLAAGDLAEGGRGQGGWWGWSDGKLALEFLFWAGAGHDGHAARLRAGLRPARARAAAARCWPRRPRAGRGPARAAAPRRPRAGRRNRARSARLFPPRRRRRAGAARRAGRGGRARCRSRSRAGRSRPSSTRRRACRAGSTRAPCCRRSIPWSGSGRGPSGCSASATGSRSTRPRTSASTATTCCPSCWATGWWPGSTCGATARPAACACWRSIWSRASPSAVVAGPLARGAAPARWLARPGAGRRTTTPIGSSCRLAILNRLTDACLATFLGNCGMERTGVRQGSCPTPLIDDC